MTMPADMTPSRAQDGAVVLWRAPRRKIEWRNERNRAAWGGDLVEYRALPLAAYQALVARGERQEEALRFYANAENYERPLVVDDTMGANVPKDCPDKDAHARQNCEPFGVEQPVVPHDCGLPNGMDDPREHVVMRTDVVNGGWWIIPAVKDKGAKARAALAISPHARGEAERALTFSALRALNVPRVAAFGQTLTSWSAMEWACAAAGEMGELCNVLKKRSRKEDPKRPGRDITGKPIPTLRDVADEIADVLIYLDLLAAREGIDVGEAVARKWNETSEKMGHAPRLAPPSLLSPPKPAADDGVGG